MKSKTSIGSLMTVLLDAFMIPLIDVIKGRGLRIEPCGTADNTPII